MQIVKILKNTYNKAQFNKYQAVVKLLEGVLYESSCNGNSGHSDSECQMLFSSKNGYFGNIVVNKISGDPSSCAFIRLDPSLLSKEQVQVALAIGGKDQVLRTWFRNKPRGLDYNIPKQ